jgi:hypothetical protein
MQATSSSPFLPIQQAVQLHLHHKYAFHFHEVANAFLLKYNFENRFCYTTIASSRQIDSDQFEIVRRMENTMSSKPVYERIIFNRADQSVRGYTFEKQADKAYVEHYVYQQGNGENSGQTLYDMFIYKNPGLKKMLRFKLHNWGVQTLESIIKKESELKEKLREGREAIMEKKEALLEKKDKIVMETKEKVNQKINEIKNQ